MVELPFTGSIDVVRRAPSPQAHPLWGHVPSLSADPLGALLRWQRAHGDVVRLRLGMSTAHVVSHPDHVRWVLQENHRNYSKNTRGYAKLSLFLGRGLLTSDGALWRRQRRIAQPAFHRQRIASFAAIMTRAAESALDRWQPWIRRGEPFDLASEMMRVTLRIVGEALFGVDLSAEAAQVQEAIRFIQRDAGRRIHGVFDAPLVIPTPNNLRLRAAIGTLDDILWRVIGERRRELERGQTPEDLLGMLMEARDIDSGEAMSDAQLRDEVMTMFLAGHESTANALTWTFYLLSRHPNVADELGEELARFGRTPGIDDLASLELTGAVIKESMRLYPPAWSVGRAPLRDDDIGGYRIPAHSLVILSPWVTHRHPEFWREPEAFLPRRFLEQPGIEKVRYQYFPFGAGPRVCIGNAFASMEATLVLAVLAQRLRFEVLGDVIPEPDITLRPRHGLCVVARKVGD